MSEKQNKTQQVAVSQPKPSSTIQIGGTPVIDLSNLPQNVREELERDYAKGMVNIALRAQELQVDVNVLRNTLNQLSDATKAAGDAGNAATVSHTQTTTHGRTEILMGNTDSARSGKLTRSQTGQTDYTPYYIFAVIAAVVLVALIMSR